MTAGMIEKQPQMVEERLVLALRPLAALAMGCRFDIITRGVKRIPNHGSFLLLAKHQRWEDIPILGVAAPRVLCYVAKYELFRHRLSAHMLRRLGGIPLNRQNPMRSRDSLRLIKGAFDAGHGVVVFPEGTYFRDRMGPGHLGVVRFILRRQPVPVIAAGFQYGPARGRTTVEIRFGYRQFIAPGESIRGFLQKRMVEIARLSGLPSQ